MKLINYIKNMDRTKRYVILFVLISFISILGVGCYNSFNKVETSNSRNIDTIIICASKKTEKEINNLKNVCQNNEFVNIIKSGNEVLENNTLEINNPEDNKNNSKNKISGDVTNNNSTSNNSSTNNTQSKTDTAASNTDKQKKHVYVQVKGVDSTWVSKQISYDNSLTAYDALKIACQGTGNEVHIKNNAYGAYGGVYVEGIGDLYEKDYGGTSGWKYKVNGTCPSVACSNYNLNEGDTLVWYYAMSMYD